MKTRQYIIVAVAAVLILVVGILLKNALSAQKEKEAKKPVTKSVTTVPVEKVVYSEIETELEYFGRVGSFQEVALIAEVQGELMAGSVSLKNGQSIRKGQLLYRVDDREVRLSLQSSKSQFQQSIAGILADLQIDYPERFPAWQQYFENLDVSKPLPALPEAKNLQEKTFLSTRGIYTSYYNLLAMEERLDRYRSYAPFSGTLSNVMLEPGSVVNPGSRIATLIRSSKLELVLPVRDEDLKWLKINTEVTVRNEQGNGTWKGRITRIGEQVEVSTQSVNVYVSLDGTTETPVRQGQYLKAILPGKVVRQAMEIPRRALFNQDNVYVVQDSVLAVLPVTVHKENASTAIISGIPTGSQLVSEIPLNAEEGLTVTTKPAP